jgi:hypothetical protein
VSKQSASFGKPIDIGRFHHRMTETTEVAVAVVSDNEQNIAFRCIGGGRIVRARDNSQNDQDKLMSHLNSVRANRNLLHRTVRDESRHQALGVL